METPILTPMQQLVEKLKQDVKYYDGLLEHAYKYHPNDVFQFKCNARAAEATIKTISEYLHKEQEAIEQAWKDGWLNGFDLTQHTATEYFNQTYKEHGK